MTAFVEMKGAVAPVAEVLLFPHAGGSANAYQTVLKHPNLAVKVAEYPGRGRRFNDALSPTFPALVDDLVQKLAPTALPRVLVGHSFGSLVAEGVAAALAAKGQAPKGVVMSCHPGSRAPELRKRIHDGTQAQVLAYLDGLGGVPAAARASDELMQLWLPIFRNDMRLLVEAQPPPAPLSVPLLGLAAKGDFEVTPEHVRRWSESTTGPSQFVELEGGHFAPVETPGLLLGRLLPFLAGLGVTVR